VFDALSHERCYKEAWPMDKIIEFFESESGKHFDADLVNIFLQNIEDCQAINQLFPA